MMYLCFLAEFRSLGGMQYPMKKIAMYLDAPDQTPELDLFLA
jgi:hypothetical protein